MFIKFRHALAIAACGVAIYPAHAAQTLIDLDMSSVKKAEPAIQERVVEPPPMPPISAVRSIFRSPSAVVATVRLANGKETRLYEGISDGGWTVTSISDKTVTLTGPKGHVVKMDVGNDMTAPAAGGSAALPPPVLVGR